MCVIIEASQTLARPAEDPFRRPSTQQQSGDAQGRQLENKIKGPLATVGQLLPRTNENIISALLPLPTYPRLVRPNKDIMHANRLNWYVSGCRDRKRADTCFPSNRNNGCTSSGGHLSGNGGSRRAIIVSCGWGVVDRAIRLPRVMSLLLFQPTSLFCL